MEAQYDCDGDDDDELSFVAGEIITVTGTYTLIYNVTNEFLLGQEEDDWWIGHIESQPHRVGCFPIIFVKVIDQRQLKKK